MAPHGRPPARRPVRELGNGPTDLALLASALERAAKSVAAVEMPSLLEVLQHPDATLGPHEGHAGQ